MVERLVAAGREVLIRDGYSAFSTNRVADRADVSPGSLYQYFPNKAAIIDVIVDRYWDETAQRVTASLVDNAGQFDAEAVPMIIEALLSALDQDRELLRVIVEELPAARFRQQRAALEQRIRDLATAYLTVALGESPARASRQAWVLVMAMEAISTRWVLDRPQISRSELVDELTTMVTTSFGERLSGRGNGTSRSAR